MIVYAKNCGVEIGQRIEINEARADHSIPKVYAPCHFAWEAVPDEDDFPILEDYFAVG
jgi:hypothetical protein